ncbi:hypothetical protein SASPL_130558 [Salvia splendens]|uniref:Bromo domain-containing protein n=1 Tax=Salvia splendens TaxID=180675 RepID=A0A8X8X983_SALSN|nr:hypothetical protein SASPL_130558 [Salvia splendens]
MYSAANQFADDMVLTFGNAMSYHPPTSKLYRCARLLDCNFRRSWEILAPKLKLIKPEKTTLSGVNRCQEQLEAASMASRERERNAARMALEKIKKTVVIDSPPNLLREMDILFGCYSNPKSLEKIGFCLKQNYVKEDESRRGRY